MTPADANDSYRRMMNGVGETVTLRRNATAPFIDADVRARVVGYEPHEIVGTIQQGDRKLVVLAEDLEGTAWADLLPRNNDKVIVRGKTLNVQAADDSTRRVQGELIAIEIQARG